MLEELRIRNFALIDELDVTFSGGFNVLTGETGAGKSIILNAVHLLLGDRATDDVVRSSEEEASVEALFDISKNMGVKDQLQERLPRMRSGEDDVLIVRRLISRTGRARAFVNETLATLGMLSEIGERLLTICGQHEHQTLQRMETHIDLLDEFGGLHPLRDGLRERFERFISVSEEIRKIREERERGLKERELLSFQSREIGNAGLRIGEEESLREERAILTHAKKLAGFADSSEEALYGSEGSAIERIQTLLRQGREVVGIDPSLAPILKGFESALIQLEENARGLRDYSKRIEFNPGRVEEIENRLAEVDRLKRKYGVSIEDVLRFKDRVDESLRSLTSDEERLPRVEASLAALRQEVNTRSEALSSERKRVAAELKKAIEKELGSLGMKRTSFLVRFDPVPVSAKGIDRVEFLISPNVGEEVKPLARIASGGELSRIMLTMKKILAGAGGRQVLVFDEVDSGIGGAIAEVVGRKLRELSRSHQVICVTHLPQIACFADTHHSVKKEVRGGRTVTLMERLEKETVVDEIARMMGGMKITEKTRAHAREMIENAQK